MYSLCFQPVFKEKNGNMDWKFAKNDDERRLF